jgi:DNA-binding YbaB/EbfC family protein
MPNPFANLPGGMSGLAQRMQDQARKIETELGNERIEASSGGGKVTAIANGKGELLDLKISADVVDPNDVEMLQDLVITAIRDVLQQSVALREERVMGVLPPGLNLPGLM